MAKNVFGLVHTMLDDSGALEPGGSIEVYDAGTTTARTVYSDRALTTTAGYQITADAAGRLPERWIADATLVFRSTPPRGRRPVWRGFTHAARSNADTSAERARCSVSAKAGRVRD